MKNYTEIEKKYIEDIASLVTVYRHDKTGARICTMENDDTNKVFSIAFRTPPINDCGLTHILEHSVLCGSKNFPVKDPFVELLKGSLNTFLNAFTFPDKTMYPCASQNDKDFANLMHVYMDAVFYPRIYQNKEIFLQEGWHYHLENKEEPLTINGVVYNEMKGSFSDPQRALGSYIQRELFPNTAYGFESGGDPKYIPELSYETFCNFHSKFYHPSNSYIYLYGNCDMEERMAWLDEAYLSHFDAIDFDTRLQYQKSFEAPKNVVYEYAIGKEEELKDKTFLSYNTVFPTTLDIKQCIATRILMNTLFDVPGAPLKQALIDAHIGQDISSSFDDELLQPVLSIVAVNANPEDQEKFVSIIENELKTLVKEGLDKDAILSLINHAEFAARERGFSPSFPQGLNVIITALSSYLYAEDAPFKKIEILQYFRELKDDVKTGYFENIIEEYILKNTHKANVTLVPSHTIGEEKEQKFKESMAAYKASLSDEELDAIVKETKHLSDYQNEEDTEEAIATLPKLSIEDIKAEPEHFNLEVLEDGTLFSEYHTNDIAYVKYYFDISHLNLEDLQYTSLFTDVFKQMSTSKRSYREINQMILSSFGTFYSTLNPYKTVEKEAKNYLVFGYSALTEHVKEANALLVELLTDTQYGDEKRLLEYLSELKANLDMSVVQRGHLVAAKRASSYIDEFAWVRDSIAGISYIDFVSDILANFETKKNVVIEKLSSIVKTLVSKKNYILGFTGSKAQYTTLKPIFDQFKDSLVEEPTLHVEAFKEHIQAEGFTAPFDVNYVARAGKFSREYHGGLMVLSNALNMDYLWMQVRVHGGAYGCFSQIDPSGIILFTSYRDPNIKKTNDVYQASSQFVEQLEMDEAQLLKYKIGAIGNSEAVRHVKDKADVARGLYLRGMTDEMRKKNRQQILSVTVDEIHSFKEIFKEAMSVYAMTTVGNATKIDEAKDMFTTIRPLTK